MTLTGKFRSSCTYKPTIYNPTVYKVASSGVVKQENISASATTSASFSRMKYTTTSTAESLRSSLCFTKLLTSSSPSATAAVSTYNVISSPAILTYIMTHL